MGRRRVILEVGSLVPSPKGGREGAIILAVAVRVSCARDWRVDVPLDTSVVVNWRREYKFSAVARVRRRFRMTEMVDNTLDKIMLANSYSPTSQ